MPARTHSLEFRKLTHQSPDYEATVELRGRLLRVPIGLAFEPEELAAESADLHLAGFDATGTLIACLVLSPEADVKTIRMRQVAVKPKWQRRGIGGQLVTFAESVANANGFTLMNLHARLDVAAFYKRLGYSQAGSPFTEVGIPHVAMRKVLQIDESSGPQAT
jgi:predicted GNAT family N-acyltransferase